MNEQIQESVNVSIERTNDEIIEAAIKSANSNPFGFEVIVDKSVTGNRFGVTTSDVCQIIKVSPSGRLKSMPVVHGSRYVPMSVKDFYTHVKEIQTLAGLENSEVMPMVLDNGGRIFAVIKNNKPVSIGGNKMSMNIFIATSFNGKTSLMIGFNTSFHRCANMYSTAVGTMKHRHTKNLENVIFDYKAEIAGVQVAMNEFVVNSESLINESLDTLQAQALTKQLVGIKSDVDMNLVIGDTNEVKLARKSNGISAQKVARYEDILGSYATESSDLGSNRWAWFNAVTHYTTHVMNKSGRDLLALDNRKMRINDKAMAIATSVL